MANTNNSSVRKQSARLDIKAQENIKISVKYEGDEITQSFIEQMRSRFDKEVRDDLDVLRQAKAF